MKRIINKYGLWLMLFASAFLLSASIFFFAKRNKWLDKEFAYQLSLQHISDKLSTINLLVKNAESGVRGYAATGNQEFLTGFRENLIDLKETARMLMTEKEKQGMEPFSQMLFALDSQVKKRIVQLQQTKALAENNPRAAIQLIRTGPGESITQTIGLLDGEAGSKLKASRETFLYTNYRNNVYAYISLSGSLLLILFSLYLLFKEINWRKRISHELNFQKERFRITLQSMHDGLISTDSEGFITFMNPTAERLTGWSWSEAKNQPLQTIYYVINEETGAVIDDLLETILKKGKSSEWENNTILRSRYNEKFVISKSAAPVLNENGKVEGAVFVFNDITEKKKAEKALKKSEEKYRCLVEQAADGILIFDLHGNFISVNTSGCEALGYDNETLLALNLSDITPDKYKGKLPVKILDLLAGKTVQAEREFKRSDGSVFFTEIRAQLTTDENILVIVRNLSDAKKTEKKLKQLAQAVEQSPASVIITDITGSIEYVNKQFTKVTGFSAEEVLGVNPRVLKSGYTSTEEYKNLWETISSGKEWRCEFQNKKRAGNFSGSRH